jgi:CRISPR-associated protein Csm3
MTETEIKNEPRQIISKIFIDGTLITKTGLHIGGNSVGMAIGSTDNVVIRDPLNNYPYIPGSSIRGKMRSLMERVRGFEKPDSETGGFYWDGRRAMPGRNPHTKTAQLFGVAAEEAGKSIGVSTATRLIVRDAYLTKDSIKTLMNAPNTDMPMTEIKTEVVIDRITAAATPRQMERVPAGAEFELHLVLTLMVGDETHQFLDLISEALRLIEADTLGGSGSRGYGQVKFNIDQVLARKVSDYLTGTPAQPIENHQILTEFKRAN